MKPIFAWFLVATLTLGGLGGGYHYYLSQNPKKIALVVDSSYPMKAVWNQIPRLLDQLDDQRYASYALYSEKRKIHDWATSLSAPKKLPYAPRDFSKLAEGQWTADLDQATRRILVTNASVDETSSLDGWEVIRLRH